MMSILRMKKTKFDAILSVIETFASGRVTDPPLRGKTTRPLKYPFTKNADASHAAQPPDEQYVGPSSAHANASRSRMRSTKQSVDVRREHAFLVRNHRADSVSVEALTLAES